MDGAERWRILRLHVEDEIPLAELVRDTKVSLRTLERWHRLFQEGGIAALDPRPRVDAGSRRTAAETVAFIERLALNKPRPSLATLHRLAVADARQRNAPAHLDDSHITTTQKIDIRPSSRRPQAQARTYFPSFSLRHPKALLKKLWDDATRFSLRTSR